MIPTIASVIQIVLPIPIMLTVITGMSTIIHVIMVLLYRIRRLITNVHIIVDSGSFCHYSLHYRYYSWSYQVHFIIIDIRSMVHMIIIIDIASTTNLQNQVGQIDRRV